MRRFAAIALAAALAVPSIRAAAQDFDFEPPTDATNPALPASLHDLAERVLPVYAEDDPDRYLTNLAALQMAIGDASAALDTRRRLRERLDSEQSALPQARAAVYDIYVEARTIEASAEPESFASAYRQAFEAALRDVDDLDAYEIERWLVAPLEPRQQTLQDALDEQRGKTSIALEDALDLVRAWFVFEAYRTFGGLVQPLLAEETRQRYVIEEVAIPVAAGATIAATLVRPRATDGGTRATILEVTLDRSSRDAREAAAHGYASVLALARIAGEQQFRPRAPFETEGADAWAAIAWIAQQPWSDGRVAMQGSGYGGFAAWSVAKLDPPALRAIATSDPMAPGIDVPSSNRIVLNSSYRWVYDILAAPGDALAADDARWREIDEEWYRSGRAYRELPTLPGRASAIFRSWLNHPSYDGFWRKWLPFDSELAKVDVPILTLTGYYSAAETAALYYFGEHERHAPEADHTLLIGPYDERSLARRDSVAVRALPLDAVARIDAAAVRYAWLAHVLGGAERPGILRGKVNYELAGANEWRHEPSLAALERDPLRFYLQASQGERHALARQRSDEPMSLIQVRDLRDRTDPSWRPQHELVLAEIEPRESMLFSTQPFDEPVELAGRLRGELDFTVNKYDVDLVLMLYEVRPSGEYVKLFDPAYAFRASYARDRVHRRLLTAGVRQQLPFQSERMIGHRLQAGSRLLLTVGINRRADQQINYGGTGDVSEQSIEDAGAPVQIRWHEGSYIEISSGGRTTSRDGAVSRQ